MISLFFLNYFLPIPFMLLYSLKTDRFNRFYGLFDFPFLVVSGFVAFALKFLYQFYGVFIVDSILFFLYSNLVCLGVIAFQKKCNLPQALSISFNLAFFNSVYWEIPIHIYTILYHGYVDMAAHLHVLYALPIFFVYQKIRLPNPAWKNYALFLSGLLISTLCLLPVITFHSPDIWNNPPPSWAGLLWLLNRIICFLILCKIYVKGELSK